MYTFLQFYTQTHLLEKNYVGLTAIEKDKSFYKAV